MATPLCGFIPPLQNHMEERLPNGQEKTLPQYDLDHESNIPNWGAGADQGGTEVPHQSAQGNLSHPPLVPQDQVLQASDSVSIWEI